MVIQNIASSTHPMIAKEMICTNQEIVMALLNPKSAPMSFEKRA
jgi:hypothetical protein